MLILFNELKHFFEDNYRRVSVREYARLTKISPPTASKVLQYFNKEGLLKKEQDKIYIYYFANKENKLFIDLSRIYWHNQIKNSGLLDFIEKELTNPTVILFGSISKAEVTPNSDIDIAIFSAINKELRTIHFEEKLNRKIQIFLFPKREDIKNKSLLNNILNGYILLGGW